MNKFVAAATIALGGMLLAGAPPLFAQSDSIRAEDGSVWRKCANETGVCRLQDRRRVAFGAAGKWIYREDVKSIPCTNEAFGRDPAPGVKKACYYKGYADDRPLAAVDSNWAHCAGEGGVCRFTGERRVAFGAKGRWVYRIVNNGIHCNANRFGKDPIEGVVKACYIDPNY